jgi:hypothetical protein
MKNTLNVLAVTFGLLLISAPALAQSLTPVPEPMSMSLFAGGAAAVALVSRLRRK